MNLKSLVILAMGCFLFLPSCGDDDEIMDTSRDLTLDISGLEDLGTGFAYEGWIIVDGAPVSTGVFNVDDAGSLSEVKFDLPNDQLDKATTFVLTIEPSPDSDPSPSATHILAGDFAGNSASISTGHGAALGNDFMSAAGTFILATPTNGADTDERSGIWFLDLDAGPGASLNLPTLPEGWAYEGWAVISGVPVTSGTFTSVNGVDDSAPFSSTSPGPPFPGEDFLINAPMGTTFPTDLRGATVVVSVEPVPDNSPNPFTLKPLIGMVAMDAGDHTSLGMNNNAAATNPSGSVSR